jgi:serine/threonine protein kinase
VYVAYDEMTAGTPRKVAIKHIINAFVSPTDARRIYREIKVMAHFNHPNILPLYEVIKPRDSAGFTHIYLVSELMETDLHRVIHSRQDLTSDHISYFIYQTLCALKCIHAAGVLHRDLKPSNLLVNSDCSVKMCDFGLARESEPSMSVAFTEYVVTRWYRAPEVLLSGGKYTSAVDVWSVGCVLAELLLRRPLFPGENYLHQLQLITEILGSPSESDLHFVRSEAARNFMLRLPKYDGIALTTLFPHVKGPCLDLLAKMLTFDPDRRASVDDALSHPFLQRVRTARKHANEDAAPPTRPFRLRVAGGSNGLRNMAVDQIKQRFYAELCGHPITPTPSGSGKDLSFDLSRLDQTAVAVPQAGGAKMPLTATAASAAAPVSAAPSAPQAPASAAEDEDRPPAGWNEDMSEDDDSEFYEDAGEDDESFDDEEDVYGDGRPATGGARGGAALTAAEMARRQRASSAARGPGAAAAAGGRAIDPAAAVAAAHANAFAHYAANTGMGASSAPAGAAPGGAPGGLPSGAPRPTNIPISQLAAAAVAAGNRNPAASSLLGGSIPISAYAAPAGSQGGAGGGASVTPAGVPISIIGGRPGSVSMPGAPMARPPGTTR